MGIDDLVKRIVKRGTTLTETDSRAVLRLWFEEAADCIAEGNAIRSDAFETNLTVV